MLNSALRQLLPWSGQSSAANNYTSAPAAKVKAVQVRHTHNAVGVLNNPPVVSSSTKAPGTVQKNRSLEFRDRSKEVHIADADAREQEEKPQQLAVSAVKGRPHRSAYVAYGVVRAVTKLRAMARNKQAKEEALSKQAQVQVQHRRRSEEYLRRNSGHFEETPAPRHANGHKDRMHFVVADVKSLTESVIFSAEAPFKQTNNNRRVTPVTGDDHMLGVIQQQQQQQHQLGHGQGDCQDVVAEEKAGLSLRQEGREAKDAPSPADLDGVTGNMGDLVLEQSDKFY